MKAILFFISLIILITGCEKKDNSGCSGQQYSYTFNNNKQIDTVRHSSGSFFATINSGSNLVFKYEYISSVCASIADDGHTDVLIFEIPAGSTSFELKQPVDFQNSKCYFTRTCFCANVSSRLVTGTINGTRLFNNRWSVNASVTEPVNNISVSFNKQFVLE